MTSVFELPGLELRQQGERVELALKGDWTATESGVRSRAEIETLAERMAAPAHVQLNSRELGRWDSALILFLSQLQEVASRQRDGPLTLDLTELPEPARRLLALAARPDGASVAQPGPRRMLLSLIGDAAARRWRGIAAAAEIVGEVVLCGGAAVSRRSYARAVDVLELMLQAGAEAIAIVAICNGLVGAILAFVGAVQLRRFGAGIYVADLVWASRPYARWPP